MKRSCVSFTSHLCELNDPDESDSSKNGPDDSIRVFRRCKSSSDVRGHHKRHVRHKTSPSSYFVKAGNLFPLSSALQRDKNIGLDLVMLDQLKERSAMPIASLSSSFFLPPPRHEHDPTFGLLSLTINETDNSENNGPPALVRA